MRYLTLIFASLSLCLLSCNNSSTNDKNSAFFGGEIVNPKGDNIIFYNRKLKINDTIPLDSKNRFAFNISNLTPGFYSFRHGGEIQFLILEPQDSVMIRLNTDEFDESLVFTGHGARKNNYLVRTFLSNEKESRKLVEYSKKEPEDFDKFISERHKKELDYLERFIDKGKISPMAKSILKANIDYHNYADREIYPFAYYGENKMVHIKDLPENFYNFRNDVDYNAKSLSEVFAYTRYLFFHFDNLAVTDYYKNNEFHSKFNRHELSYNKAKLNLVDDLVKNDIIKNSILKYKTREFINHTKSQDEIKQIMALYISKTTNEDDIKYMNGVISSLDNLKPGKGLPDLKIINPDNEEYTIADVVKKPTLIYFWSTNVKKNYRNSHYRVKELKAKFPTMGFMSININDNSEKYWKEPINQYKFDLGNEYRFKNPKEALETLAVNYLYKVIIVDEKANIINPNVNLFSKNFETLLENMILKKELVLH